MVSHDQSKDESPDDLRGESFPARQQSEAGERRSGAPPSYSKAVRFILEHSPEKTLVAAVELFRSITAFQFVTSACLEAQPDQAKALRGIAHTLTVIIPLLDAGASPEIVGAALLHPSLVPFPDEDRAAVYSGMRSLLGYENNGSPLPPTLIREPQFESRASSAKLADWIKNFNFAESAWHASQNQPAVADPIVPDPPSASLGAHKKLIIESFDKLIEPASRPSTAAYTTSNLSMISTSLLEAYNLFAHARLTASPRPPGAAFQHLCQVGLILAATRQRANVVVAGLLHDIYELRFSLAETADIRRLMKIFPERVGLLIDAVTEPNDEGVRTGFFPRKLSVVERLRGLPESLRRDACTLVCASKISTLVEGHQYLLRAGSLEGWSKGSAANNALIGDSLLLEFDKNDVSDELVAMYANTLGAFQKSLAARSPRGSSSPQ